LLGGAGEKPKQIGGGAGEPAEPAPKELAKS